MSSAKGIALNIGCDPGILVNKLAIHHDDVVDRDRAKSEITS